MRQRRSSSKLKTIVKSDLMTKPQDWDGFFEAVAHLRNNTHDFLTPSERKLPTQDRDPFDGVVNHKP
jgi:hypothetical protein